MNRLQMQSIAMNILEYLVHELDMYVSFGYRPGAVLHYGFERYAYIRDSKNSSQYRRAYNRITSYAFTEVSDGVHELNNKGLQDYLRLQISKSELLHTGAFLLSFDVPEARKNTRNRIRRCLKSLGFLYMHRSVWLTNINAEKQIIDLLLAMGMRRNEFRLWSIQ